MQAGFRNDKPIQYIQIPAVVVDAGFTLNPPAPATVAIIIAEGQAIRWRDDVTAPLAAVGMPLAVGVPLRYEGNLNAFKLISQVAGAIVNVSYYA